MYMMCNTTVSFKYIYLKLTVNTCCTSELKHHFDYHHISCNIPRYISDLVKL